MAQHYLGPHPRPMFKLWYGAFRSACRAQPGLVEHHHAYFSFARDEEGRVSIRQTGCRRPLSPKKVARPLK